MAEGARDVPREEWDGQVTGLPFEERPYGRVRLSENLCRTLRQILVEELDRTTIVFDDENRAARRKRERRQDHARLILHNVEGTLAEKGWT